MNAASATLPLDSTAVAPASQRFIDNADGTVTDQTTGLMWSKDTLSKKCVTHKTAEKTCAELDLAGHKDWRLPNPHELQSLVDYAKHSPAIDIEAFPDTKNDWYWTSTVHAADSDYAWIVNFYNGDVYNANRGNLNAFVRAVRPSQ